MTRSLIVLLSSLAAIGCGGSWPPLEDGGNHSPKADLGVASDSGVVDMSDLLDASDADAFHRGDGGRGRKDGGSPGKDGGVKDGGSPGKDGGVKDGGSPGKDGGAKDGGSPGKDGGTGGSSGTTLFPPTAPWYKDISKSPKDKDSDSAIQAVLSKGGWGNGNKMQIDFGLVVLHADAATPMRSFSANEYFYSPDCDKATVPVPANGAVEGGNGYVCGDIDDEDCHLLVIDDAHKKLYEMWRASISGNTFSGGCLAVWDLTKDYVPSGRGENCTSADAGGYPMTALLFTADEVAAGQIDHAIRFILPNDRIAKGYYVHPATHNTNAQASNTAAGSPPYGARFRLRADYPIDSLPSAGAKVVARAMQKYGMLLSDGGQVALTAASDSYTTHKWKGLLGASDLTALKVSDFEMVDGGAHISSSSDCKRANQ